ncbi:hypothetical protein BJV78DRAFT_1120054 [Lactifluus subvellereus]|nr:hypothetical protein BJV78DRAFT_1120054 [Lactifluus subvellereus]
MHTQPDLQNHSECLVSKEWLVKIDYNKSVPYLSKMHATFSDQTCVFLITDTKTVWAEVLSRQQLGRRWLMLNTNSTSSYLPHCEQDSWLNQVLQYLMDAHSPDVMEGLSFDVVESRYSDLAIDLQGDTFKWRWETSFIGPKQSADVLSKHLIIPLLSTADLAFTMQNAISGISDYDLEKAVDQKGRAARRRVDEHTMRTFLDPRICTSIRRMSALLAFNANPPPILDRFEKPELILPSVDPGAGSQRTPQETPTTRVPSANLEQAQSSNRRVRGISCAAARQAPQADIRGQATTRDSATETGEDSDGVLVPVHRKRGKGKGALPSIATTTHSKSASRTGSPGSSISGSHPPATAARSGVPSKHPSSHPDFPPRPNKRAREKGQDRSDDDSDDGAKRGELKRRGTKQPVKRGGRQF